MRKTTVIAISTGVLLSSIAALQFLRGQHSGKPERASEICVLISFGYSQTAPEFWQGRARTAGGEPVRLRGWRLGPQDSLTPEGNWKIKSVPQTIPAREIWPGAA